MRVWRDIAQVDPGLGPTVVTVGNFDGVHIGHRHVLARARELAAEQVPDGAAPLPVVAVTFDPHPLSVITPDKAPERLTSLDRRLALLADAGADGVLVLSFTPQLQAVSAEDFAATYLLEGLRPAAVVVGENFRFGHRARGDVALLRRLCEPRGVLVEGIALDGAGDGTGRVWSSTYVRRCLADGDVAAAAEALGRPFTVRGVVVPGDRRGRELLGYPTANLPVDSSRTAVPADGVYAGWLRSLQPPGSPYLPAAISVGTNPTFDGVDRRVESYVLDRDDLELYGVEVEVAFTERLRGMVKFDSIQDLIAQMDADVARARDLLTQPPVVADLPG